MPIRAENRGKYPKNWDEIRERILHRARHCCEICLVPNSITVYRRNSDGAWFDERDATWRSPDDGHVVGDAHQARTNPHYLESVGDARTVPIVLTIMHLDHDPTHCDDVNLKAGCQQCHNRHDALNRARGRKERDRVGRALGDLFEEGKS